MGFSFRGNGGRDEISVKRATIVVDPEKLSEDNPEMKRLYDITTGAIEDIQAIVEIALSNIAAALHSAVEAGDKEMANFALGGLGQFTGATHAINQYVDQCIQTAIPIMLEKGLIDFDDEVEQDENAKPWEFS